MAETIRSRNARAGLPNPPLSAGFGNPAGASRDLLKTDFDVTRRPITPEDEPFLYRVYASTREAELAQLDWDESQKAAFLEMQFRAQHRYYQEQFAQADFDLILLDGEPIGRLYVERGEDEIRIVDIALLAEHRRKGIGSALLKGVLGAAERAGLPVRIHVERNNPALALYTRLGFRRVDERGFYDLMEWSPEQVRQ